MAAMFNIPTANDSAKSEIEWESMELPSLPPVLAKEVVGIHADEKALKERKAKFADNFNNSYSEEVPNNMVRRFSFKFNGLSFGNAEIGKSKTGKVKVKFTAKKVAK